MVGQVEPVEVVNIVLRCEIPNEIYLPHITGHRPITQVGAPKSYCFYSHYSTPFIQFNKHAPPTKMGSRPFLSPLVCFVFVWSWQQLSIRSIRSARRVLLRERSALPNKASRMTEEPESSFAQNIWEPLAPLPEHITELYEDSAEGKTKDEKKIICWLLLKHQGVFSQTKNYLGQTNLVEHTIDTGDAKPIKQPPHYLLIAFGDGIVNSWPSP